MDGAIPVALEMKPGDIVLLITDGFFEWQNRKEEEFGAERLATVVRKFSDREPEIIIAELYDAVLKFSQGTPQNDDLTAVLIKRVTVEACPVEMVAAARTQELTKV
jgi:phosphoserine phosphatase RsbU/P